MPNRIPINRLLLLTALSYGIYLYYWFYLTWKQYRDHTGHPAFPAWHALAIGVPVYGLYRVHGHMAAYNKLMLQSGAPVTINPLFAVTLILISTLLSLAAAILYLISIFQSGALSPSEPPGVEMILMKKGLDVLNIATAAAFLTYVQPKLNRYWESLPQADLAKGTSWTAEMICVVIGILAWASAAVSVVVAS